MQEPDEAPDGLTPGAVEVASPRRCVTSVAGTDVGSGSHPSSPERRPCHHDFSLLLSDRLPPESGPLATF